MKFAVIVSRFNEEVTEGLLSGAKAYLKEKQIHLEEKHIFRAPGAFEIPLMSQSMAKTKQYYGVI